MVRAILLTALIISLYHFIDLSIHSSVERLLIQLLNSFHKYIDAVMKVFCAQIREKQNYWVMHILLFPISLCSRFAPKTFSAHLGLQQVNPAVLR